MPAVVEVSPYRHEDNTRRRDSVRHPYFAEHGYASLRIDIRGSGPKHPEFLQGYNLITGEYTEAMQAPLAELGEHAVVVVEPVHLSRAPLEVLVVLALAVLALGWSLAALLVACSGGVRGRTPDAPADRPCCARSVPAP